MLEDGDFLCDLELIKVGLVLQVVDLLLQLVVFLGQASDVAAAVVENVVEFRLEFEYSSLQLLVFNC